MSATTLEGRIYPENGRAEVAVSSKALASMRPKYWPNDCAECGTRMTFVFEPEPHRACPACAHTITASQCLRP